MSMLETTHLHHLVLHANNIEFVIQDNHILIMMMNDWYFHKDYQNFRYWLFEYNIMCLRRLIYPNQN